MDELLKLDLEELDELLKIDLDSPHWPDALKAIEDMPELDLGLEELDDMLGGDGEWQRQQ